MSPKDDRQPLEITIAAWRRRLEQRPTFDRDLVDELDDHLRQLIGELIERGRALDDAVQAATTQLGDAAALEVELTKLARSEADEGTASRPVSEASPSASSPAMPGGFTPPRASLLSRVRGRLWQDLRYAARMMVRTPTATAAAVITLAAGIGANATVFSLLNATLLSPPPGVRAADELVLVYHRYNDDPFLMPYPKYAEYRDRNDIFNGISAWAQAPLHLRAPERSVRIQGALVSGDYFDTLGVSAALGRVLRPDDDRVPGAHPVAVISHRLWRGQFGGESEIIGEDVVVNGHPFTIVGVIEAGFQGIEVGSADDVWVPMMMQGQIMPSRTDLLTSERNGWIKCLGRLRAGIDIAGAEERMSALVRSLEHETIGGDGALLYGDIWVSPYLRDDLTDFNALLAGVVGLVLLLACANVANLLLTQASGRREEIAVRRALGATRTRLVIQLVTEGAVLAVGGGTAGLLLAYWGTRLLSAFHLGSNLALAEVGLVVDGTVIGATLLLSLVVGVGFALLPALRVAGRDVAGAIRATNMTGARRGLRARGLLVMAQVAVSFVLLVGAGLLVRTLLNLKAIDPGFDARNVVTLAVDLELEGYDETRGQGFYRELLERVRRLPGVESASVADIVPFTGISLSRGSGSTRAYLDGREIPDTVPDRWAPLPDGPIFMGLSYVEGDYFRTLGIPVIAGRGFTPADATRGSGIVVSKQAADALWPGESPLGQILHLDAKDAPPHEVIGVVADVKSGGLLARESLFVYRPLEASYRPNLTFVARATAEPESVASAVHGAARDLDSGLAFYRVGTLGDSIDSSLREQSLTTGLLATFGALALCLATVGLFGVLWHSIVQRTRELGVRMALGAGRQHVVRMLLRQSLGMTLGGTMLGLAGAAATVRVLESSIYGVATFDPITFAGVAAILVAVGALASLLPARRAVRIDPVEALRAE